MIMPPGQNGMMPQNVFAQRLGIGAPTDPPAYPRPVMPGMGAAPPQPWGGQPVMQPGMGGYPQPQPGMPPQTPMPMNNIRQRLGI